jgi:hypothetical protein
MFVIFGELMGSPFLRPKGFSQHVRCGILRRAVSSVRQRLERLAWRFGWRWPRVYRLLLEIGRILPRIRFALRELSVDRDRELCAGPVYHLNKDGSHRESTRTHARIRGIREQEKLCPWMGMVEVYLFFRGWNAAERFLAGSSCTESGTENKSEVCTLRNPPPWGCAMTPSQPPVYAKPLRLGSSGAVTAAGRFLRADGALLCADRA